MQLAAEPARVVDVEPDHELRLRLLHLPVERLGDRAWKDDRSRHEHVRGLRLLRRIPVVRIAVIHWELPSVSGGLELLVVVLDSPSRATWPLAASLSSCCAAPLDGDDAHAFLRTDPAMKSWTSAGRKSVRSPT